MKLYLGGGVAGIRLVAVFWAVMQVVVRCQMTVNGPVSHGSECCGTHLMDSTPRRVAIETSRPLAPGVCVALQVRACTTDAFDVQVWRRVDDVTFQYRGTLARITPSTSQSQYAYLIIPVSTSLSVNTSDFLGIYSAAASQVPVPFDASSSSSVAVSVSPDLTPLNWTAGQRVTLDTYRWTRSFQNYLAPCYTNSCIDVPPGFNSGANGGCCRPETTVCDVSPDVINGLDGSSATLQSLQTTVNQLNDLLNTLISQNYVTGLCPQGFLTGVYGIGSCYLLFKLPTTMADSVYTCRQYGATLVTIETALEEQFVAGMVSNDTLPVQDRSAVKIWTAGMFDQATTRRWFWYAGVDPSLTSLNVSSLYVQQNQFVYTNWLNGVSPTPLTANDICMSLNINMMTDTDYWTNNFCTNQYYFICELPKRCL